MAVIRSSLVNANKGDVIRPDRKANRWILIYVRQGTAQCSVDAGEHFLSGRQIVIVPPTADLCIVPRDYYQHIEVETTQQILPGKDRIFWFHDMKETADSILWLVFQQMNMKYTNYESVVASLMDALSFFLLSQADQGPNSDLIELEKLLRENIGNQGFEIEKALARIPQTTSYTRRLFRRAYGCAPVPYLNKLRVGNAKILLMTRNLPISEIAEQCGFADPKYFTRRFKEITGYTPTDFRKTFGGKNVSTHISANLNVSD